MNSLEDLSSNDKTEWPVLSTYVNSLKMGILKNVPIVTEPGNNLRSRNKENELNDPAATNEAEISKALLELQNITKLMITQLKENIAEPLLVTKMREAFVNWNEDSLKALITMSVTSERNYGNKDKILEEFRILKDRVLVDNWKSCIKEGKRMNKNIHTGEYCTDAAMWLQVFTKPVFYIGCENILHLAICLFVKAPLEAIVESVGSVINRHGNKASASMKAEHLAN